MAYWCCKSSARNAKRRTVNDTCGNNGTKSGSGNGSQCGPDPNAKSGAAEFGTNDDMPFWH